MTSPSNTKTRPDAKSYSSEPAGVILGKPGLLTMLMVLILAAWFGQMILVIVTGLVLTAAGLANLWSHFSLVGVNCQRFISEQRLFPGEHTDLRLRLVNRKPLPLPWIQVDEEIPANLTPDAPTRPGNRVGYDFLSNATSLLWYTGINWRCRLHASKRGYYPLGPIVVTSGDIFGFYPRTFTQPSNDRIIVYPRLFPLHYLGLPSLHPIGETKAEQRIFEDPTRTISVRNYTPHDSLKYIHWKATARHQKLQVKVFEPTTTLKTAIFLAVDSFHDNSGAISEEDFELGISTVASIANYIVEQRSPVGLFVNSRLADSGQPVRIPPSSSVNRLVNMLEALAKITSIPTASFDDFLQNERRGLPWGTTTIIVTAKPSDSVAVLLTGLREGKHKPLVFQIGEQGIVEHTVPWYRVRNPDDLIEFKERP
ncbi:DUF58 domain-containing protein [Chloroflexota bacterium]